MSNILNKSSHPVHVNRIPVRLWTLRDEIEKAIAIRIQECEEKGIPLDTSDIKKYYTRTKKDFSAYYDQALADGVDPEADSNLDSSGNEMDEDALAMQAALEEANNENKTDETSEESDDEEKSEADLEAEKLAEMMLADQGGSTEETSGEDANQPANDFKRVLPDPDKVSSGFAFLSDIDMSKILSFSKTGFTLGQNICIEFLIPNGFIMSGEVVGSNFVGRNSRIISEMKPDHRIMTAFSFLFDHERDNLREFLKSIEPDIPPSPKKLKRPAMDDDEDDEFEDLGF